MPQPLYFRETAPVPILEEEGGAQQRFGRVLVDRKTLAATGIYLFILFIYLFMYLFIYSIYLD
jgi:hypothetical protein